MRCTARADGLLTARPLVSTLLRRFLLLGLLAAGWLLGLTLATAAAGHADTAPARPVAEGGGDSGRSDGGGGPSEGKRRTGVLDRAVTGLVKDSLHGLARTAEDVPGTLHTTVHRPLSKTVHTVTATLGDTPRVLGRSGPADAPHPTAPHAAPGRGTDGLPPPERGAAAGHPITSALRPLPVPGAGAGSGSALGTGAGSRTARHDTAHGSAAHRRAASLHDHPRTPVPYAPAAPVSLTAGPAASSSNAAGPAFFLGGPGRHPLTALSPTSGGSFRPMPHAPAREPRHTPD